MEFVDRMSVQFVLLLVATAACVWGKELGAKPKGMNQTSSGTVLWKSLLIHHHRWSGYYEHDQTRYVCGMYVHSVDVSKEGLAHISFAAEGFHIEMMVSSEDNKAVTFKEVHTWNNTGHFQVHTNIVFQGAFVQDYGYFKMVANVSSAEVQSYGSVTLIPQGRTLSDGPHHKSKKNTMSLAMSVAIPLFLGLIVLTLAAFIVIWAVKKGYLRQLPWHYKSFRNPETTKRDVEMEGGAGRREEEGREGSDNGTAAVTVQGVEKTAVHI